ncbi:ABC transporter permease subunit, partial [Vibrio parahaemolyticus]|uniref:cytochrome b/b6 domain-containing protein n=1 Tax=Vibrio parahaemolyticus TaxID=670 RepID=UPI0017ECE644|nr:hypothetical protein [Vibrio parahaemolyticus]
SEDGRALHEPIGYVIAAAVALRLAWGLGGPRYARFAQFVRGPGATLAYAGAAWSGRAPRYVGHNPLGAWMILALLALLNWGLDSTRLGAMIRATVDNQRLAAALGIPVKRVFMI